MKKFIAAVAVAGAILAAPAFAQDAADTSAPEQTTPGSPQPGEATSPDGSRAFGLEPYVGVMGGWESFDSDAGHGIPSHRRLNGSLVQGVAGFNIPLGPVFVGAEGNAAKGISGGIDWEYGAAGRFGFRAGDSGLFYGKVGYQWVNFDHFNGIGNGGGDTSRDYHAMSYGIGAEVGPKDIGLGGLTSRAGVRLRFEVSTFGKADSFRPMAGVIAHF